MDTRVGKKPDNELLLAALISHWKVIEGKAGQNLLESHLVSIGVHGGQQVDAGLCDQPHHSLVAPLVLLAHVLHEVEQQLATQHLVPVHPGNVAELWLSCTGDQYQSNGPVMSEKQAVITAGCSGCDSSRGHSDFIHHPALIQPSFLFVCSVPTTLKSHTFFSPPVKISSNRKLTGWRLQTAEEHGGALSIKY